MKLVLLNAFIIGISAVIVRFDIENGEPQTSLMSFSEDIIEAKMGLQTRHLLNIQIGSPYQTVKLKISTAICGAWVLDKRVFKHGYVFESSETAIDLQRRGKIDFTKGQMVSDKFFFCQTSTKENIPFLLVQEVEKNENELNYDGLIGFGYKCSSSSIGNIDLVKILIDNNSDKYKENIIFFHFSRENRTGWFGAGEYPKDMNRESKLYKRVSVDQSNKNGHWEVNLYSVYFSDCHLIKVNKPLSIGIGGSVFSVSEDVFRYIVNYIFNPHIESGECEVTKEDVWEIICENNFDEEQIGSINLVLGKWTLKLKPKPLFHAIRKEGRKKKWFCVVYYPSQNSFYLSQGILDGFRTFVYNKDESEIGIYSGYLKFEEK